MKVLLSNDDGIHSPLLRSLYAALKSAGHDVRVVAPHLERSGFSSSVTIQTPLMVSELCEPDFEGTAVQGTPADCVLMALGGLFPEEYRPDVVMSGINRGPNASLDVLFSGTVGAALQGAMAGIPAVAVSSCQVSSHNRDQAREAVSLMERINMHDAPLNTIYNINFPDCDLDLVQGLKVCPLNRAWESFGRYVRRQNPAGRPYWWVEEITSHLNAGEPGTDQGWLRRNYITLTPLRYDLSDYEAMAGLRYLEK